MTHEIILNHLTINEFARHNENFEQYTRDVTMFFQIKGMFIYEKDILNRYGKKSMEDVTATYPNKFVFAGKRRNNRGEEFAPTWFDISSDYKIMPKDAMYDLFFTYQLRNIDILETDDFLNYQFKKHFDNDIAKFKRFIVLTIRKHGKKLLDLDQIETVNEWMTMINSEVEVSGILTERSKGKLKREAGDNLTALNLHQIALLIHFMQEAKIILKDEYLNKTQAGQAFSTLTGYSADALRLELNSEKFNFSKENISEMLNIITRLEILIKNKLPKK